MAYGRHVSDLCLNLDYEHSVKHDLHAWLGLNRGRVRLGSRINKQIFDDFCWNIIIKLKIAVPSKEEKYTESSEFTREKTITTNK